MGYLVLTLSYFLYGLSDAVGPLAFRMGSDSTTLAFFNCALPLPFIAATMVATRVGFRIDRRALFASSALGIVAGLTALTLNGSYVFNGAGIGTTLHMSHTLVASFGEAALERRRPRVGTLVALVVVLCGVGVFSLVGERFAGSAVGIALALLSGLTYGMVALLAGHSAARRAPAFQAQFYAFLFATATLAIYTLATRGYVAPSLPARAWGVHFFCAITTNYAAFALVCLGMRRVGSTAGSIMGALEPIFCAVFSVFILAERFTPANILGCALILIGVVIEPLCAAATKTAAGPR